MHDDYTEEQLKQLQQKLLSEQLSIQELLDDGGESSVVELDQSRMGRLSRIDAIQRQEMAKKHQERMKKQLHQIFLALRRLELYTDEFGYCAKCGESIPFGRMLLRPMTQICVPCLNEEGG